MRHAISAKWRRELSKPFIAISVAPVSIVLLILAVCLAALAQEPSPYSGATTTSNGASETPRFSIGGTVVSSATGEPVARALVSAGNRQYAMTDSNGHFQIAGVPQGDTWVSAEKPGFFSPGQLGSMTEPRTMVNLTANVDDVVLKLVPQAVIVGRAASINGEPIEDFPIRLHIRRIVEGRAQWQPGGATQTDEDGQFRIAELTPGQYLLSAGPENARVGAPGTHVRGYAKAFFPNSPDSASASIIDLSAGQQFEADFALSPEPMYEISGQVVGVPAEAGVGFNLFDSAGEELNLLSFRDRQRFIGYVPAGKYTLRLYSHTGSQELSATVPLTVAGNMAGIQAVLAPEIGIPVNIRAESTAGPQNRGSRTQAQTVVRLLPASSTLDQNEFSSMPAQQGSESYIRGVPPGTYSVEVQTWGGMYVQSVSSGGTDLLHEPLVVTPGGNIDAIDVVLRDDGGRVSGSFQDERLGMVVLLPDRGPASEIQMQRVMGSFVFDQVRPGDYTVLAFDRADGLEYKNPEFLTPYLSRGAHVTVASKQEANVNLDLIQVER